MSRRTVSTCNWVVLVLGLSIHAMGCDSHEPAPGEPSLAMSDLTAAAQKDHGDGKGKILYLEKFSKGARGWLKIAGPGLLEVVDHTFRHTTNAYSAWCEYAYTGGTFGNARYELDLYVSEAVLCTQFAWRAPALCKLANNDGSYLALFNNSTISPGTPGNFILHKHDRTLGNVILLDIPQHFYGLNHLEIVDRGTTVSVTINGTNYGTIDVSGYTPVAPGYIFLTGGDRGAGDYFDNITVR